MAKKRQENLLAKIANLLEKPLEEVKEMRSLYTDEEAAYEAQSVLNYYDWRKKLEKIKDEPQREYDKRYRIWQYKECAGCKEWFAYSYHYDGVKFCSLDCLQIGLREIGLKVTYGQPLMKRWGLRYPGIVPSSALRIVESVLAASSESGTLTVQSFPPISLEDAQSENHQEISLPQQDMPNAQDNQRNTA